MDDSEATRIRTVYGEYTDKGFAQTKWSAENPGNQAILAERTSVLGSMLGRAGFVDLGAIRILEVGCGGGTVLRGLLTLGAKPSSLCGIDVLDDRILAARKEIPGADIRVADARRIPFPDATIELVLYFTVFSSVLDPVIAQQIATEASRVVKPGGAIVCYDFRYGSPGNRNVRPIKCQGVETLFRGFRPIWRSLTLLPPLARRLGPLTPILYPVLAALSPLRTHLMGVLVKPEKHDGN